MALSAFSWDSTDCTGGSCETARFLFDGCLRTFGEPVGDSVEFVFCVTAAIVCGQSRVPYLSNS